MCARMNTRKKLFLDLGRQFIVSLAIYVLVFLVLLLLEHYNPALQGQLLQWDKLAFIVGIPASILGTAYVLAIKNPNNYLGFYPGIIMSLLLSWQFYLQGSYDLTLLYVVVFIPFQIVSLVQWRKAVMQPKRQKMDKVVPQFLKARPAVWSAVIGLVLVALDYAVATWIMADDLHRGDWEYNIGIKLASAFTIASSILANFWLIYKKNDAWMCWILYNIASIILFLAMGNMFSVMLFVVCLFVNASAQVAWLRSTAADDWGWVASRERIEQVMHQYMEYLLRRDGRKEDLLIRQEQRLKKQLEKNKKRRESLLTTQNGVQIKFGHIVDVVNERIYDGEIEIRNGKIMAIRETQVPEGAHYILPGFVDSHVHIESTLLMPEHYAHIAVTQGVLSAVTDPHEIANVLGEKGVQLMMDSASKVRMHIAFGIPSCVPTTDLETAGAVLDAHQVAEMMEDDRVFGLAEMMNVPGVLNHDPQVMAKIQAALDLGKQVDGHCPQLTGEDLLAYIAAGVSSDHESSTLAEAQEKLKAGMYILIREGSAACNLDALAPLLKESNDHIMFCSDDKYPDEMILGYIDQMVVRCIRQGLPMWNVLKAACVTPVRHYGLSQGLLQVGDNADFICVHDLVDFYVREAYMDGKCVYRGDIVLDDMMLNHRPTYTLDNDAKCPNHFLATPITPEMIRVPYQENKRLRVIGSHEGSLLTDQLWFQPHVEAGWVISDTQQDVLKMVCYSRHSQSQPQVAFVHGFGFRRGAIASTIGHDSHNIIAVGVDDYEIARAINHLVKIKGGLVVCDGPELIDMELPIAGLISVRNGYQVGKRHCQMKAMTDRLGCKYRSPFMTLAFMPLSVIPELKLTDKGLLDTRTFSFTDIWE